MATKWSDNIVIAELADEPALSEELAALIQRVEAMDGGAGGRRKGAGQTPPHLVLNFANVTYIGSSTIGQLLTLRKALATRERQLKLCSVGDQVWSIFLVTGLDKVFRFAPDPMTALAGIQLEDQSSGERA